MTEETKPYSQRALIIATFVSILGGFLFGYDNLVISGAIEYLTKYFSLDAVDKGWAAGCALVGCLAGSAAAGMVVDKFGLKKGLYLCAFCFAASSVGVWMSGSFISFVVWRIVGGVGIGAASIIAPMYIAEISPSRMRGRLVILYQLGIVIGVLSAVIVNMLIQRSGTEAWNMTTGWKWMFMAGLGPGRVVFWNDHTRRGKPALADESGSQKRSPRCHPSDRWSEGRPRRDSHHRTVAAG